MNEAQIISCAKLRFKTFWMALITGKKSKNRHKMGFSEKYSEFSLYFSSALFAQLHLVAFAKQNFTPSAENFEEPSRV